MGTGTTTSAEVSLSWLKDQISQTLAEAGLLAEEDRGTKSNGIVVGVGKPGYHPDPEVAERLQAQGDVILFQGTLSEAQSAQFNDLMEESFGEHMKRMHTYYSESGRNVIYGHHML